MDFINIRPLVEKNLGVFSLKTQTTMVEMMTQLLAAF